MEELPVIFRSWKRGKLQYGVEAVFPTLPGSRDPSTFTCYAHIEQHGTGHESWYGTETRPATPAEYRSLLTELRGIYETGPDAVRLVVVRRMTAAHRKARQAALARIEVAA